MIFLSVVYVRLCFLEPAKALKSFKRKSLHTQGLGPQARALCSRGAKNWNLDFISNSKWLSGPILQRQSSCVNWGKKCLHRRAQPTLTQHRVGKWQQRHLLSMYSNNHFQSPVYSTDWNLKIMGNGRGAPAFHTVKTILLFLLRITFYSLLCKSILQKRIL